MTTPTPTPHTLPLPPSPSSSSRSPEPTPPSSRRSSNFSTRSLLTPAVSPRTVIRPRFDRAETSTTIRQGGGNSGPIDSFYESSTISVNQPVGSLSISPSSRDVCLASRKGLYILDLANLNNAPRFIPQGGTWQIADCQWSPHPATSNLILSTSSQKLLVWDLSGQKCLYKSIDAHARAITDINWHARNPNLMATTSMDAGIRGWDLRAWDRPFMRVCAWGAAGTQVKWNRQHEYTLATAHGKEVIVWDIRKGSVPLVTIQAHDAKIYGIDWDRQCADKLVTCSLDKTIKFWSIEEMASSSGKIDIERKFSDHLRSPEEPYHTIQTNYPVWRARNLPFGHGVLSLPQRDRHNLDMFGMHTEAPVEVFEGHDDVVKEFVWRSRGGEDPSCEDREFQLVTWSKDRTLRIWPVGKDIAERVGYKRGAPIQVLLSRRGAADITYTRMPDAEDKKTLPPPVVNPSGIARQKMAKADTGMTRGGGTRTKGMDQLEWLTKVVKNKASPDSSTLPSRVGSMSRNGSRPPSTEGKGETRMSLKDEVVMVNKYFPRPRVNFEKIDLHHRRLTLSMSGPWANGDRMAFMRIHWSFPATYPYTPDNPTFELERNPTISSITRQKLIMTIKAIRAQDRQCLVQTCSFLLAGHARVGRLIEEEDSDSEGEKDPRMINVPMLIRTCGATFGPNGQLVCFFPKQTLLPRTKQVSRSPSASREARNPFNKAMSALSRMDNSHQRNTIRVKPRMRRLENLPTTVQAGSTLTIHHVAYLGNPDAVLAKAYGVSLSPEINLIKAFEAKRLDHAEVWSTLRGILNDQPPPPYAPDTLHLEHQVESRRVREAWERGMARKKLVLAELFTTLIAARDFQLLALVSCILLDHVRKNPPPPRPEPVSHTTPEQDYFALPRVQSHVSVRSMRNTPSRKLSRASITPLSPGLSSYRNSGWSQVLNPSSISLRGHITPSHRTSFDIPKTTPIETTFEESSPVGLSIPYNNNRNNSPRYRDRPRMSGIASASPTTMMPYKSSGTSTGGTGASASAGRSGIVMSTSEDVKPFSDPNQHSAGLSSIIPGPSTGPGGSKVTFGSSNSPLRRNFSRAQMSTVYSDGGGGRNRTRVCSVRIDLLMDETEPPSLLDQKLRVLCEGFKLAYADFLLRSELLGIRAKLLQFEFVDQNPNVQAASGILPLPIKPEVSSELRRAKYICVECASGSEKCLSCSQATVKPLCSYCRLPIKGLATSCAICAHRSHAKCFRVHFTGSTNTTCPSCLCQCAQSGGLSGRRLRISAPINPIAPPEVTRGSARGSITIKPGGAEQQRLTYASIAMQTIREDHPGAAAGGHADSGSGIASALGLSPEGVTPVVETGGWRGWDTSRLGWAGALAGHGGETTPEAPGSGRESRGRGENKDRDGLLARAKLGGAFRSESRGGGGHR